MMGWVCLPLVLGQELSGDIVSREDRCSFSLESTWYEGPEAGMQVSGWRAMLS